MDRKRAAILHADFVGDNRPIGDEEAGVLVTRTKLLDGFGNAIKNAGGRIVDRNDGMVLAEFADAVTAVNSAIAIQRDAAGPGGSAADAQKAGFRIGVDVGDVNVDEHRVFGDAVDVAAHLGTLPVPGGICISIRVLEQVEDKLKVGFAYLGEHAVTTIGTPVKAFSVLLDSSDAGEVTGVRSRGPVWPWLVLALGIWFLVAGAALLWWRFR